jgi:hypothetical protein
VTDMEDKCRVCGQTRRWHMEHQPHHVFSLTSAMPTTPEIEAKKQELEHPQKPRLQGDIVLRMALLKAGLLGEQDLEEARTWMEKAAEFGKAVVLEPDPASMTGWRYRLVTQEQLIREMVGGPDAPSEEQGAG